jgi:diguanylate cyclase (GGDEF)-like protein
VGSFKVRLVAYFVLMSLVPLGALVWGFSSLEAKNGTQRVDARLQAGLRASLAAYDDRVRAAQASAEALARSRPFQVALERRDIVQLRTLLHARPGLEVVTAGGKVRVGRVAPLGARRRVAVLVQGRLAGSVIASVPFDRSLAAALRARSGLAPWDSVALVRGGRIVAASPAHVGRLPLHGYRMLSAPPLAVLTPQSRIDSANASARDRLLLALLGLLALVAFVAYVEGRAIVRSLRGLAQAAQGIAGGQLSERVDVRGRDELAQLGGAFNQMATQLETRVAELEAERGRLRDAITRFGEALGATHDIEQLLRVIVEAAIEATGAKGAILRADDGAVVAAGDPAEEGERLELPLNAGRERFGTLVLVGQGFDAEQRMTAASLASHAAIALENARLHRVVEKQALVDELTGIANRRRCEEALATEIARAERFGTPLSLVLADLDDFKAVNDKHGHPVGDDVLRRFTSVLRAMSRETDLAGRWGGEEFLILLPGSDVDGGAQLAERMRRGLAGIGSPAVTCSFGVAQYTRGQTPEALFLAADRALYGAKRLGKNRVEADAPSRSF